MLKRFRIEDKFDETNLISQWEKVMGVPIAKRTTKIYIRNKKLFVHLNSAPLKHELNMSRDRILVLLTKELGKPIVNEVVIKWILEFTSWIKFLINSETKDFRLPAFNTSIP